jgi:DNA-binding transcriptional LysR family regulator
MELRHLRYFVAIGEEENYRRAAQRLNVAQTALSTQIQDLEAELGFKLFDRLPRGVKLSAAGKLFLADARRILRDVNEAASRAARVARGQSGTLRVGFTENASWRGVVPESLRRFRKRQPDAELQLTPATSLEQIEAIRSGRLDAGQRVVRPVRQAASGNRGSAARSCASESSWSSGKAQTRTAGWLPRHPSFGSQCLHWLNPGTSPRRNESCDGSRHSENHKRER